MDYLISLAILIVAVLAFFLLARGRYLQSALIQWPLRILVAIPLLLSAVVLHFVKTNEGTAMIPPVFPATEFLVLFTGVVEILGAIGLFLKKTRRQAALWLTILMVAIFPANIWVAGQTFGGMQMPSVPVRLAMQVVYIWMILLAGYGLPRFPNRGPRNPA